MSQDRAIPGLTKLNPIPPKARAFQGLRAGVVSRTAAGAIDYAIIIGILIGAYISVAVIRFLVLPTSTQLPHWPLWVVLLMGFGLMVAYLTLAFGTRGRTVGDRVLGLRVVGHKGTRMWWGVAFVRAVFCTLFPIGLWWCAISRENRSVQDLVLRTSVIHEWPTPVRVPDPVDVEGRTDL
jgi:uncharacterized RDD family membrane protein YckC